MKGSFGTAEILVKAKKGFSQRLSGFSIGKLINSHFYKNPEMEAFHKKHGNKQYTFTPLLTMDLGTVYGNIEQDGYYKFRVHSSNYEFLTFLETQLTENNYLKVLDVVLSTTSYYNTFDYLQVKEPILYRNKKENKVYYVGRESNESDIATYLDQLNQFVISDYNYTMGKQVPSDFKVFTDLQRPVTGHVEHFEHGKPKLNKFIGTTGNFILNRDNIAQEIAVYLQYSGIGNKSAYLGTGSSIPRHFNEQGETF